MEKLQSNQFTVMVIPPATAYGPVDGRKYTLTEMDSGNSQILTIGTKYQMGAYDAKIADILTAEWKPRLGEYVLSGRIYIGDDHLDVDTAKHTYHQLKTKLTRMISAMIQADYVLYQYVPWLLDAPIMIQIDSHLPLLRTLEHYGTPRKYLNNHF